MTAFSHTLQNPQRLLARCNPPRTFNFTAATDSLRGTAAALHQHWKLTASLLLGSRQRGLALKTCNFAAATDSLRGTAAALHQHRQLTASLLSGIKAKGATGLGGAQSTGASLGCITEAG